MICDWCRADVIKTYRVYESEEDRVWVCLDCRRDVDYCEAKGQIPQNPEENHA